MAMDLALDGVGPLSRQVYAALRDDILNGRLPHHDRLPSTRALAQSLGVSRTTVLAAYEALHAEGFLGARSTAGCFVTFDATFEHHASLLDTPAQDDTPAQPDDTPAQRASLRPSVARGVRWVTSAERVRYDFRFGVPNPDDFPKGLWRRLLRRQFGRDADRYFDYQPPEGDAGLRAAIARHHTRHRGLRCTADEVLVTTGAQQAFDLIARTFTAGGDVVAMEEPGYRGFPAVLEPDRRVVPIDVDNEGLRVEQLEATRPRLVHVTPAHQFPTGAVMSINRRRQLLQIANEHDMLIVEDDYDSEIRYEQKPIAPLKAIDEHDRVLFVGSFSKTLFPALRLGFIVASALQIERLALRKARFDVATPLLDQRLLADFIDEGHFERTLRRQRRTNGARRDATVKSLVRQFGEQAVVSGAAAGLSLMVGFPGQRATAERQRLDALRRADVMAYPGGLFYQRRPPHLSFVLGYSRLSVSEIEEGIRRFAEVLHR